MEIRNPLLSRSVGIKEENHATTSNRKMSLRKTRQRKRPKSILTQQSSGSVTRAMRTRSACAATVPIWSEMERLKTRAKNSRNIKAVFKPTFVQIKCDKKHFPVMKSSCETIKGIMTICSHDIKCSPTLLNEQQLDMISSKSFHIVATKECLPYFRNVASNDTKVFPKDELFDTIKSTREFTLIVGEDAMQTTICEVLQNLNAHIPVAGLVVHNKDRAPQYRDLSNVLFDTAMPDTIMKKADSLLNRCVHRILAVLYRKLTEAPFGSDDQVTAFDVCDMIKSSFQRNMIPQLECPEIPEHGIYPHNIDEVIDKIAREENVIGCLKKLGTLYVYLNSPQECSEIEKKIKDIIINHGVSELKPVFKYVTMENLCSSGDWACNGTLGGFAMKKMNVTSELKDRNLVALISRHVAKNTKERFLLVGQNKTKLGSIDGMKYLEDMDIYPVMVDPDQNDKCDRNFRTEDDNVKLAKLRNTKDIEILNGSIVHIWGHKTSPGLGIVVEKPLKTSNGKIIFVRDRDHEHSFAEPGDSGAMVCYYDPHGEELYAVGMLMGRCNSNGAVTAGRYAAQVLDDGLRALSEINECTLFFSDNSNP
ncbi:uncharacterized protein LOC127841095 isoform X1 [Dreissena polymorpha]|uniref:Uncharacterized protein n=1 Tax=Dreissena polymorpha TaxID=45954 RepID=A0A9D4EN92_DREPO|nr:uncharacterized protein LOC127841095 isoform X1 [Dreissena polymorpha]XP_052225612.1 uncharacterized protein LOC127841095 isoform X1 [Dreissena polymorpha]KAH3782738.1 hypothetical protein DPMN_160657 [Dreissena polymorpha]